MTTEQMHSPLADPTPPPGGGSRRWWYVAGVLALVAAVVLAFVLLRDDDDGADTVAGPTAGPSAEPTTQPSPQPTGSVPAPSQVDRSTAVWPVAGSSIRYGDPVAAARGFATDYLGFVAPVVGTFQQGDSRSGEVGVRPTADGPVTTVLVRQLSGEDSWSVLGATTAHIEVTEPAASAVVRSPVTVRGSAWAFEGQVDVQVRQDGRTGPLGEGFVTGGGDQMRPFTGSIDFDDPSAKYGALVLLTRSAKDGQVWEASVLRVQLQAGGAAPAACKVPAQATPGAGQMAVTVYFTCDPESAAEPAPFAVNRVVPQSPGVLRASLTALLAGPTDEEEAAGITSWFSEATAGMLRDVTLTGGRAVVDFDDLAAVIPNASTSAGSALLLSELDATVFQFPSVASAEYRMEGSCTAFTEWLQIGGCEPRTRP